MSQIKFNPFTTLAVAILLLFVACQKNASKEEITSKEDTTSTVITNTLFTLVSSDKTGIYFNNALTEGLNTNVLMYEYFYNGGGVAVGDVNGDELPDIYFTGNMTANRLYLNKGNMQFKDITSQANVSGREGPWKTGVTMADVNGDGLLDIYVCYSGNVSPGKRANQLFINKGADANGTPHFEDQALQYGLASSSFSTQATFLDYDRDGDLDMFLLNHSPDPLPALDEALTAQMLKQVNAQNGVRLFRNDNGHFGDVTEKAGIHSSALTYGLGAGVADINGDGWLDMYICNDYSIPDYLYINNKNGTFSDKLQSGLDYTSHFSMGNDVTDINNDGLPDIYTLDMLPEDNQRQKLLFAPDNYEKFDLNLKTGFYYQYMRNMLHVNNGNGTFSEIGQLSGISNTDWSWAPLFADYDNDGWKDLFVTNGFSRDFTNMDFTKYMSDYLRNKGRLVRSDVLELVHQIPSSNVINYIYKNNGNLTFTSMGAQWGMNIPSNSNGAAYGDLDNDGDLDLVINNINQPAFIYRNEADKQLDNHYLGVKLQGNGKNTLGLGAKVTIYSKGKQQYQEQMPTRGYQSSVSPVLHFGLGGDTIIDSLRVVWQSGKQQLIRTINADQILSLREKNAASTYSPSSKPKAIYQEIKSPVTFTHQDAVVNDFKRQPLLVNPLSFSGPCLVKGDVNGDGLEDIFAGGGSGQAGALYIQQRGGKFLPKSIEAFEKDKMSDDVDALFFDANGDTFSDLYVCSGGYDNFLPDDSLLQDRLYLNDGKGNFTKTTDALPTMNTSTSCVRATDVNGDGYADLFVGGRVIPGRYPETPQSYLLINDGQGRFKDMTSTIAPSLQRIGMVTDAAWHNLNNDKQQELIVVGEWMSVTVLANIGGKLTDQTTQYFDKNYKGWWNKILVSDVNKDGRADLLIGNLGLNSQCKASDKEPAELYYKDFDDNGSIDPILCFYIQGKSYPYVTRDEMLDQISMMRTRFTDYKSYANATLKDIFTEEELEGAGHLEANYLQTTLFLSDAQGKFHEKGLPLEAQFSPVYAIATLDYDKDGNEDLLVCGNINKARLRFGKADANQGILLKGDGKGGFTYIPQSRSGFMLEGDVRSVLPISNTLFIGMNGHGIKAFKVK